jgi:signal transduction histidine kinase
MTGRGLKAKIAVNITVFLLLGMLSIDLVTMMTAQHSLVRSEIAKGRMAAQLIAEWLIDKNLLEERIGDPSGSASIMDLLVQSGGVCLLVLSRDRRPYYLGAGRCGFQEDIERFTHASLISGSLSVNFLGSAFGLFWPEKKFLVITSALKKNDGIVGSFSLVFSLEAIYQNLRNTQNILLLFVVINTVILSFLGIYRVFKLYLQPLSRLAKRAEEYKEDDQFIFSVRKEDNELQRLSSALNSLMGRLSSEKEKLRATVVSLESANAELKKAQSEMIRTEKLASVGRLSAGIAHEIGNPIGIVTGYLELLKQTDISDEDRSEYLARTQDEIERISAIIRQLLEISRPSPVGVQQVSVHALLDDMAKVLAIQPFMAHIRISLALDAVNDVCNCDHAQLRQVFLNLVINAADAIKTNDASAQGELLVSTDNSINPIPGAGSSRAQMLNIRFSDNGPGILESNLPNIFDPFFTTKDPGKGTGLGLSVSFMIVESFDGTINVESEAGKGTTMTVSLPASTHECAKTDT